MIKKIFNWIFRERLTELTTIIKNLREITTSLEEKEKQLNNLLQNIDVSVDIHQYSRSWAVVSLQGKHTDYIKFIDLGDSDLNQIHKFLKQYERSKVDASPEASQFLKIKRQFT